MVMENKNNIKKMKNNSNIYDIDGELIRAAGDNHKMTIKEAQEKIENYRQKLEKLDEKDPKAVIYATYMRNLNQYILTKYATMKPEELEAELNRQKAEKDTKEQVEKAINELKKELENEENDEKSPGQSESESPEIGEEARSEEGSRTQEDLLIDGEGRPETVMDEYVSPIGEASDEYVQFEEVNE